MKRFTAFILAAFVVLATGSISGDNGDPATFSNWQVNSVPTTIYTAAGDLLEIEYTIRLSNASGLEEQHIVWSQWVTNSNTQSTGAVTDFYWLGEDEFVDHEDARGVNVGAPPPGITGLDVGATHNWGLVGAFSREVGEGGNEGGGVGPQ